MWIERVARRAARAWADELGSDVPAAADEPPDLPAYTVLLALNPRAWVLRRVETFEFLDFATVRRRMSVYFRFPELPGLREGATVHVPLLVLAKRDLRNFDIRDADGKALPLLTSDENAKTLATGIGGYLPEGTEVSPDDRRRLEEFIKRRERDGDTALADDGWLTALLAKVEDEQIRGALKALVGILDESFVALAALPYEGDEPCVVKLSHDVELLRGRQAGWSTMISRFFASFGLPARRERFGELAVGLGESYHAEAVAPPDTYIDAAQLEVPGRKERSDSHRFRPHVHIDSEHGRERGTFSLLLQAQRAGLVLPLLLAALTITGALVLVPRQEDSLDGQTLAALLLVPFALAAYFIRSAENSYVTQMLRGVRLVAAVPVLAGVVTITMLGLGYLAPEHGTTAEDADTIARCAAWASGGATALLALAVVSPPIVRYVGRPAVEGLVALAQRSSVLRIVTGIVVAGVPIAALLGARALVEWLIDLL
jgi:hypothetical protein